ncbi:prostaglandin E2 receptor EP1 subtype-like [Sebastes umbrosus]|uniref:prostaglandin E2 receptor EP1 subtype-like n=1 Tax=Sebastes umbrosus TaxID=72105 RepID=UPI00189E0FFE|nr:prostaglandin E2 receptor EP1 subtype-like [Sebastes umbrosus]XP_037647010.1 prostaglandin E2 receptor EP1 subtype-like [Sebastes umbrosus]
MLAMQRYNSSGIIASLPSCNHTPVVQEAVVVYNATRPAKNPMSAGLTMTLGILFNVVALIILAKAYNRFRRRSKATFLLFASSLVATDLVGHVIPGALVLSIYTAGTADAVRGDPANPDASCLFLGGCMVFFGLCPLFLGCAMAAERCLGVTKPLLHARLVTTARTKMALALIWLLALCVALLPFFSLGAYTYQYPGTWCFIRVMEGTETTDLVFVMLFSGLALSSLASAFVCNTISGITLVRARLKKRSCSRHRSARSHDTEMVVQLVGIMVTSCICWSPLLVFGLMSATQSYSGFLGNDRETYRGLMITGVRMATCNQILDPWVYILLRRAVLRKIYRITKRQASFKGSTFRSVRSEVSSFHTSEKKSVNNKI